MATNAITVIEIRHGDAVAPAAIAAEFAPNDPHRGCVKLSEMLASIGGGIRAALVRVRTDSSTNVSTDVSASTAITHANVTANDTFSIGATTFTWKASASTESEVTIGANATEDGTNLAAKINAHSQLVGLVSASNASGTVTITYLCGQREAIHMRLATSDATAHSLVQPTTSATLASVQSPRQYTRGVQ